MKLKCLLIGLVGLSACVSNQPSAGNRAGAGTADGNSTSELIGADIDDPTFFRIEIVSKDSGLLGNCQIMPSLSQKRQQNLADGQPIKETELRPQIAFGSLAICEINNNVGHTRSVVFSAAHPKENYDHFDCVMRPKRGQSEPSGSVQSSGRPAIALNFGTATLNVAHRDCKFSVGEYTDVVVTVGLH